MLRRAVGFLGDVYRDQKVAELTSFLVWEVRHRARLFSRNSYLRFNEGDALDLDSENVAALDTSASSQRFWGGRGLRLARSAQDWKVVRTSADGELVGSLYDDPARLYRSQDQGGSMTSLEEFPAAIEAIFIDSRGSVFICVLGALYRSVDGGTSFDRALEFDSAESYFRRPVGMTETPGGVLIIGEYGNTRNGRKWRSVANLYVSSDGGRTWECIDELKRSGANKHIHFVWYSDLLRRLIIADGDNRKRLRISDPVRPEDTGLPPLNLVNSFHIQMGGHTAVTEIGGSVLLGTDYMGGTNFLLETSDGRNYSRRVIPDPYRRSPIMQLQQRRAHPVNEIWGLLPYASPSTRSLLMYSRDEGRSWTRAIEYASHHGVQLIGSSTEASGVVHLSVADRRTNSRVVYEIHDR